MTGMQTRKLAVLWRGDREARCNATPQNNRFKHVFEELATLGISAEPAVYADDMANEVREQLLNVDGVLVWVNPISEEQNRTTLDAMLRDVNLGQRRSRRDPKDGSERSSSSHETSWLGHRHPSLSHRPRLPRRVSCAASIDRSARSRGNGGQGVWRVELVPPSDALSDRRPAIVRVLHARRGSVPEDMPLDDFMRRCEVYFAAEGCIVDQPLQVRLPDGMIRCYMGGDKVVGFGHQLIKALIPPPPDGPDSEAAKSGPRIMYPASAPTFQALRTKMESEWTPQMMQLLDIDAHSLPIIWDADFLYGPRAPTGEDTYVLCEINVSSVFPFPDQTPAEIARLAFARLLSSKKGARPRRIDAS